MKKILIVGSRGFIGKACVDFFKKKMQLTGCDILPGENEDNYFHILSPMDLKKVIISADFDICINASGSAQVGFSFENPGKDYELNVGTVKNILDSVKETNPSCKIINFSSAAVYGNPKSLPVSEKADVFPVSPYGKHKRESEILLQNAANENNLKTCSLRVFSAYGPGLHKQLFWDIFQKSRQEKKVRLFGTGNESRDFIYIKDLVEAINCVIDNADFCGEVYNIASGVETSIKTATNLFLNFIGNDFQVEFSGEIKNGDPLNWRADISKLKKMGFQPVTELEKGLCLTANEYLSIQSPQ